MTGAGVVEGVKQRQKTKNNKEKVKTTKKWKIKNNIKERQNLSKPCAEYLILKMSLRRFFS